MAFCWLGLQRCAFRRLFRVRLPAFRQSGSELCAGRAGLDNAEDSSVCSMFAEAMNTCA